MDPRREQLLRRLNRRRKIRLMLVCLAAAMVCGVVAGMAAPRILVGSVATTAPTAAVVDAAKAPAAGIETASPSSRPRPSNLLPLAERLGLDPREMQANAIRWSALSESERRTLLDRYWRLAELSPADQQQIFEQYAALRDLPEEQQELLRAKARKLQEFMKTLSPQDLAVLEGMSETDRAARLLELWQTRHKAW